MDDALPNAIVVAAASDDAASAITVDLTGRIIESTPGFDRVVGATGSAAGRSLAGLVAPDEQPALDELLAAGIDEPRDARTLTVAGSRIDGLPLVLELTRPPVATGTVAHDDGITLIAARGGGPVTWADDPPRPTPSRSGPDHVLSHDARASIRNARNFLGLFARKLPETPDGVEPLPTELLDTGLRALATGDEILDRIVWFLRLEDDPLAMRSLPLGLLIELAARQSQSDVDELATIDGQADLAVPVTIHDHTSAVYEDRALHVVGDSELLVWCLAELMTNARKFGRAPGADGASGGAEPPEMSIDATSRHGWVHVQLTNNGRPIDPTLAEDAFKLGRLLQARGERPGIGLGLPLCRRIVTRHGGRVTLGRSADGATVATLRLHGAAPDLPVDVV